MAYQNVGTPRFYINIAEWYLSTGAAVYENIFNAGSGIWGGIDNPNIFTVKEKIKESHLHLQRKAYTVRPIKAGEEITSYYTLY